MYNNRVAQLTYLYQVVRFIFIVICTSDSLLDPTLRSRIQVLFQDRGDLHNLVSWGVPNDYSLRPKSVRVKRSQRRENWEYSGSTNYFISVNFDSIYG